MKKSVFGMMLLGGMLLAGCSCEHAWQEATCTAPATCTECGEREGEAAAHKLSAATCTLPATCEVCGVTEGEALDHDFMVATCAQPEVCNRCGEERGERLPHTEQFIGECDRCHEIQNKDVVETILSKLEEANDYVVLANNMWIENVQEITDSAPQSTVWEDKAEVYIAMGLNTLQEFCVYLETSFRDALEEPRDMYEEMERLYDEVCDLCGEYKELADLKEKITVSIECIPEIIPEVSEEKYKEYDIPLLQADETMWQEVEALLIEPVKPYTDKWSAFAQALEGDSGYWKEMQSVGKLVDIEVNENWWEDERNE